MADFREPVDIANRALQHVGAARITALTDDTKNADECDFAYDKVRQAELQRNLWTFTTRRAILRPLDTTTMVLSPPTYSATVYYQPGQMVSYSNQIWINQTTFNYGNTPGTAGSGWDVYFGPMTVSLWVTGTTYYPGELVYVAGAVAGLASIYVALETNDDDPTDFPTYSATDTYYRGQVVRYSGSDYISMIDLNLANTPSSTYALWLASTTYAIGNVVIGVNDGRLYTSASNGNTGNVPSVGSAYWTAASSPPYVQPWLTYGGGKGDLSWRYIGNGVSMELKRPQVNYPAGTGPVADAGSNNIYILPNGFLRQAPENAGSGISTWLGGPSGNNAKDWVIEGKYLISGEADPIMLRFVANMTNVPDFPSMFCEGLAARLAMEICEPITQSADKVAVARDQYKKVMAEARAANAIELAPIEPDEDDYISVRI